MAGKLNLYDFGGGGVNLVKNPLQLADIELTQSQNGEYIADGVPGGQGSMSKRLGIQPLTSALDSGSPVSGMIGLPLQTTYVRTLYAALQSAGADTWVKTTDGTSWTAVTSPARAVLYDDKIDTVSNAGATIKLTNRIAAFGTQLIFPGNDYTIGVTNPPLRRYAGSTESDVEILRMPAGPVSSTGFADLAASDMLVANNTIYFSVQDAGGAGNDARGYVVSLDLETGRVAQVGEHFGSTSLIDGTAGPLVWYQGKLWVGTGAPTSPSGRICWAVPGVDATWTTDVNTAGESVCSMAVFRGDLFAGFEGDAGACSIKRRTASTGAWANVDTGDTTGSAHYGCLIVYENELYAVRYFTGADDVLLIRKSSDGVTWSTDSDVEAAFGGVIGSTSLFPGNAVIFDGDLYISFRSTTNLLSDGFILRKSGGTWSKVYTGNLQGAMGVLLERS